MVRQILPELEQNQVYNSFNMMLRQDTGGVTYAWATSWYTIMNVWRCPSDANNGGGIVPYGSKGTNSFNTTIPPNPNGGATGVPSQLTTC